MKLPFIIIAIYGFSFNILGQDKIGNFVANGSFEEVIQNTMPPVVKTWKAIDSFSFFGKLFTKNLPPFNVPLNSYSYQWPKHGNNYFGSTLLYIDGSNKIRGYPNARLKSNLVTGTSYCVKLYLNLTTNSTHGINSFGIYFADSSLDTISNCIIPLSYLTPQIVNPTGNFLTDTLNWTAINGTFVATGEEKYILFGNFKPDSLTDTILINPNFLPAIGVDFFYDAISCIKIDLSAYAGPDKSITPGDSVYIGRESDFAIDSGCVWFKLPNVTTAIDTTSGIWVKPTSTSTYVVKQVLECSPEKWDTVVVYMDLVGMNKLKMISEELKIYPIPANNELKLSIANSELLKEFCSLSIYNNLGLLIREEEVIPKAIGIENGLLKISTNDLSSGVYFLELKNKSNEIVNKKFLVDH